MPEVVAMTHPAELAESRDYIAGKFDIDEFTCDDCGARFSCPYAFDPYNFGGDCIAEK